MQKFYLAVVAPLLVAAVVAGATSIIKVARVEERVFSQKEALIEIRADVKWMRENWNNR